VDLEELQARWLERMHALAGVSYGQTLALVLTPCVPTKFETQTFPALLRLETQSPSACALVQQEVQDGTAAVTLLSVLGRVCRVSTPAMTSLASRGAGGAVPDRADGERRSSRPSGSRGGFQPHRTWKGSHTIRPGCGRLLPDA
jgi:hypothetical protein